MPWPPTTHQDVTEAISTLLASGEALSRVRVPVGGSISPGYAQSTTSAPAVGDLCLALQFLPSGTYDMAICRIQTPQAGGLVKIVAYDLDAADGRPSGQPVLETAQAVATSGGFLGVTLPTPLVVPSGGRVLWVGLVSQGTAGVAFWSTTFAYGPFPRVVGPGTSIDLGGTQSGTAARVTGVTGAAPIGPASSYVALDGQIYKIAFRRSA